MENLRDYIDGINELPEDILLGRVVMFTITDEPLLHADVERWFQELNLNPVHLPAPNRAVDAFKKATTDVDKLEYDIFPGGSPNMRGILLTRPVTTDNEMVVRFIVREVRDAKRRKLGHDKAIEAVFYKGQKVGGTVQKGSERIRLTRINEALEPTELAEVDKAIQTIQDRYSHYYKYLDGQKVRAMIRDYLKYLNAIEIKGGVYFIHKNRTEELLRLRELVNRCGGGCRMDQIPIVDLDNERQMIVEAFQREAEEELSTLVKDIAFVRTTRKKVSPEAYAKLKKKYDLVMNQAMEYQRTLGLSQDRTSAAAELALDSLVALQQDLLGGP
jgi:hypothetical protein